MATVAIAAAAVAGAGASAYGSSQQASAAKKAASGSSTTQPWSVQAPYLHQGYTLAEEARNKAYYSEGYTGDFDAGSNQTLQDSWGGATNFYNSTNAAGAGLAGAGQQGVNAYGQALKNTSDLYAFGTADPTATVQARASQYANNPYTDGMIDAASRDVSRNLDMSVAGNNANAVAGGNMNSTRAGQTEGMLKTTAADRVADISSQIRGQQYQNGLSLAGQQYQNQFSNMQAANQQTLQAAQAGQGMVTAGYGLQSQGLAALNSSGTQQREVANAGIQGQINQANYNDGRTLDIVSKYMNIVNNGQGSTTTTYNPSAAAYNPNYIGSAVGGAMQGYGLYQQYQNSQNANSYGAASTYAGTTGNANSYAAYQSGYNPGTITQTTL